MSITSMSSIIASFYKICVTYVEKFYTYTLSNAQISIVSLEIPFKSQQSMYDSLHKVW